MVGKKIFIKRNSHHAIEPEEILLDAPLHNHPLNPKAHLESHLETLIPSFVFYALFFIFVAGALFIFSKPLLLQMNEHGALLAAAQKNYGRVYPISAPRGIIYDRNFMALVSNEPSFDVVVIPELFDSALVNDTLFIETLAQTLQLRSDWLINFFSNINKNSTEAIPLAFNVDHDQTVKVETQFAYVNGIRIEKNSQRRYELADAISHVLGYTGRVSAADLKEGEYFPADVKGKSGLEFMYDDLLRGIAGTRRFELDAKGRVIDEVIVGEPHIGGGLLLTIDEALQKKLYETMEQSLAGHRTVDGGAAIALDPRNGEVLALVSWPGFNSNLFSEGISSRDFDTLVNDARRPLFNKAISGMYPPGSSFKPLIAAAALEENVIDPHKEINALGRLVIPNPYNSSSPSIFPDRAVFGLTDMFEALAHSVNVYFYTIGGGHGAVAGLGIERIEEYAREFGFGEKTGIDLPSEAAGLIPSPAWKSANKSSDPLWRIGDTYHVSIGQGDVLATPLQIAHYIGVIANGGTVYKPHIVSAFLDEKGRVTKKASAEIVDAHVANKEHLAIVREGMRGVTTYGTAASFSSLPFSSAGKTGTAQFGPNNSRTHSWMSAFAPYENPEIVLVVLVEGGGDSGTSAVPINREVLRWYFMEHASGF